MRHYIRFREEQHDINDRSIGRASARRDLSAPESSASEAAHEWPAGEWSPNNDGSAYERSVDDDWAESEAESKSRPEPVAVAVGIAERIIAVGWCGNVDRRGLAVNDHWPLLWRCCLLRGLRMKQPHSC